MQGTEFNENGMKVGFETGPHCNNAADGGGSEKGVVWGLFGQLGADIETAEGIGTFERSEVWGGFEILDFLALDTLFRAGGADTT